MKLGVCILAFTEPGIDWFVGLQCAKGRGIILPGGKVEPGETVFDAAYRELLEETGIKALDLRYVWHGPDETGVTDLVYAFRTHTWVNVCNTNGDEGSVIGAITWDDIYNNKHFGTYYRCLRDVFRRFR